MLRISWHVVGHSIYNSPMLNEPIISLDTFLIQFFSHPKILSTLTISQVAWTLLPPFCHYSFYLVLVHMVELYTGLVFRLCSPTSLPSVLHKALAEIEEPSHSNYIILYFKVSTISVLPSSHFPFLVHPLI